MSENGPKLTREFCDTNALIFYPKTVEESHDLQQKLFDMGYEWSRRGKTVCYVDETIAKGLLLLQRKIYHSGNDALNHGCIVCDIARLDSAWEPKPTREDEVREQYNRLSDKVDRLTALVEKVYAELHPDPSSRIDKPSLKR